MATSYAGREGQERIRERGGGRERIGRERVYLSSLCVQYLIVRKGGREANKSDELLGSLDLSYGPSHNSLQDRTSIVVQQVDLILRQVATYTHTLTQYLC